MLLYRRENTARPERIMDALAFATEIATYVTTATGVAVSPWATVYGGPLASISWTARVDSVAAMGAVGDQLLGDAKYLELVAGSSDLFSDGLQDHISELVAATGTGEPTGEYATVINAQCAPGQIGAAMAWAVDMSNHSFSVTGLNVSLMRELYGDFAHLTWITLADTRDQVDAVHTENERVHVQRA